MLLAPTPTPGSLFPCTMSLCSFEIIFFSLMPCVPHLFHKIITRRKNIYRGRGGEPTLIEGLDVVPRREVDPIKTFQYKSGEVRTTIIKLTIIFLLSNNSGKLTRSEVRIRYGLQSERAINIVVAFYFELLKFQILLDHPFVHQLSDIGSESI